ncbi:MULTISPECIES: hypothetical protein [Streptomyces]|uniref:hypothetical protein n=1 Tax=Streptomyces TaxID=1883 RepID=UPI001317B4D9|nr:MULTISPECIES: hypothetical protein [Streptomyces]QGZ52215.1 hypothetical protein GPZ77_31125 [Streptomyces sp. QHH-9511]GGT74371.1 hypothetical protein GCM10010272_17320 [Streptomyces lateritius]
MGGTDRTAENAAEAGGIDGTDDDALYVLTAVLLTPAQFPSVLGDDYPAACAALDLEPYAEGYGLVLGQDGAGARWTVIVDDVSLVAVAIASWDCGMEYELSPDERSVVAALPGWPLAVASAAPDLPAPHDPEPEEGDRAPLAPPSADTWGPAQRRLGADEVALQWAAWRSQMDDEGTVDSDTEAGPGTGTDAGTDAGSDRPHDPQEPHDPYDGVRRALAELRGYLEEPPPVGRVRSSFAAGGARMLRADGPGWSLVARTDDMAFVLLDDEPREVLPVARGTKLPALLEALDAMAVRPS